MLDVGSMTPEQIVKSYISVDVVADQLLAARMAGRPYSLIRVGDGENAVLSQLVGCEYRERWWATSDHRYCGITLPNRRALAEMVHACHRADVVGILFQDGDKWWRPMTQRTFAAAGIRPRQIMYAYDNLALAEHPRFLHLLRSGKVAVVGRTAADLARLLVDQDVSICFTRSLESYEQVPDVMSALARASMDICLASCGVNAVFIAQQVAERLGGIGIDLGSASDRLLDGRLRLHGTDRESDRRQTP